MRTHRIASMGGDGIGPEVVAAAERALHEAVQRGRNCVATAARRAA